MVSISAYDPELPANTSVAVVRSDYAAQCRITDQSRSFRSLSSERAALPGTSVIFDHLACGIVHDFNNHLTGIVGCLQLMQAEVAKHNTDGVTRYVDAAVGAAQRATALAQRLLNFSRRDTGLAEPTDLNDLIAGIQVLLQVAVGPSVKLNFQTGQPVSPVLVERCQLENAVLNLCINARSAMRDGGEVTIATRDEQIEPVAASAGQGQPGGFVCLSVTDTGTGISSEHIARICDPYFTTKPAGQGTGLGLSILRDFVAQVDGHLQITSQIGHGTTFSIYLPQYPSEAVARQVIIHDAT